MARITLSPLIVDLRASVADMTFSKWKGTNYVRSRVVPANPNTPDQVAVRDNVANLVALWQTFPNAIKQNWNLYAQGTGMSGYNQFVKINSQRLFNDQPIMLAWQGYSLPMSVFTLGAGAAQGDLAITFASTPVPASTEQYHFIYKIVDGRYIWSYHYMEYGDASPANYHNYSIGVNHYALGVRWLTIDSNFSAFGATYATGAAVPHI